MEGHGRFERETSLTDRIERLDAERSGWSAERAKVLLAYDRTEDDDPAKAEALDELLRLTDRIHAVEAEISSAIADLNG